MSARLVIGGWHSSCGECGYGGGSWVDSPALEGKPILTPESTECPGCGVVFTETENPWGDVRIEVVSQ